MLYLFVSCWTHGAGRGGIAQYAADPETGALELLRVIDGDTDFGTVFLDRERNILYALNETAALPPHKSAGGGRIFSYRLDPETGAAEKLGETPTWCPNPSYFGLDPARRFAVVSNHSGRGAATKLVRGEDGFRPEIVTDDAVVELFALNADGSVGALLDADWHLGHGPGARQDGPHPHCAVASPDGRLFAVCDKGNDGVYLYTPDGRSLGTPRVTQAAPGSMPRYACFHPEKPFFYHNNEGSAVVCAYRYDADGALTPIGEFPALAEASGEKREQQDLLMHPSGRVLYDLVNGADCVSVFAVDGGTGALHLVQSCPAGYAWPRGIALSPDGRFAAVACLRGGKLVIFSVKPDGTLCPTGLEYDRSDAAAPLYWQT